MAPAATKCWSPPCGGFGRQRTGRELIAEITSYKKHHNSLADNTSPAPSLLRCMSLKLAPSPIRPALAQSIRHRRHSGPTRYSPTGRPVTHKRHSAGDTVSDIGIATPTARCNHSITSSAMEIMSSGTSRPMALAVLRLTTNRYLTGNSTGRSLGLVPRKMRFRK